MRTGGVAFGRLPIDVGLPYKKLKPYEHLTQRYHMPEKEMWYVLALTQFLTASHSLRQL